MTKINICGISQVDHALAVAEAGADFMSLVFATSKRRVSPDTAHQIVHALDGLKSCPLIVGVFVNTPVLEVNQLADSCGLDWIQLSGDESWEYCKQIQRPVIKVIRVTGTEDAERILTELSRGNRILGPEAFTCLLDSEVEGTYGGTGQSFDWKVAGKVARQYPLILAGGLSPESVKQAIKTVRPWGVDVSSGVETDGIKDVSKIKAFVRAVRRADEKFKYTPR